MAKNVPLLVNEEYPKAIREPLMEVENIFAEKVNDKLQGVYARILTFAKDRLNAKKDIRGDLMSIFSQSDFIMDLPMLLTATRVAVKYQQTNIKNTLRDRGVNPNHIKTAFGVDLNVAPEDVMFADLIGQRTAFLAKVLAQTTLDRANTIIEAGVRLGKPYKDIADQLTQQLGFDGTRAMTIARTETAYAVNEGTREWMRDSGVKEIEPNLAGDACEDCQAILDGAPYSVDDEGILPAHPRCKCVWKAIIPDEWFGVGKSTTKDMLIKNEHEKRTADLLEMLRGVDGQNGEDGENGKDGKQGNPGQDGYTPVKGKDYFTEPEIKDFIKKSTPTKGKDYLTDGELLEIKKSVLPMKGKDYMTKAEIASIVDNITPTLTKVVKKSLTLKKSSKNSYITKGEIQGIMTERLGKIKITVPKTNWGDILGKVANQTDLVAYIASQTGVPNISAIAPLVWNVVPDTLSINQSNTTTDGYLSSTDWNTFNAKEVPLTFTSGVTRTGNNVTNDLITGFAGGQDVYGGTAASEELKLHSTTNATKGLVVISRQDMVTTPISAATQISSEILSFRSWTWNGSVAALSNWTVQSVASTTVNSKSDLTFSYNGGIAWALLSDGTLKSPSTNTGGIKMYNTTDEVTNYERLFIAWSGNIIAFDGRSAGTGSSARVMRFFAGGTSSATMELNANSSLTHGFLSVSRASSAINNIHFTTEGAMTGASGISTGIAVLNSYSGQTGTAGWNALLLNPADTGSSSGVKRLISAQLGGVDKFVVDSLGNTTWADAANIAFGTTTGTKIGTLGGASGQKIGFFNTTPIVQPLLATGTSKTVDNVITVLQNLGLARQS